MEWIYADDAEQQHEFAEEAFPSLISEGRIRRDTLVWNETLPDWKPCAEIRPDLFDGVPDPPPLTSAQRSQIYQTGSELTAHAGPPPLDPVSLCALIFGILGIICVQIFSIPAIVCGHIGMKRANENPGNSTNKGFAITGLITGYLGLLILIVIVAIYGTALAIGFSEGFETTE